VDDRILTNAKIICFASAKGGSGKTVTATSLAKFLAFLGKKVLLVDMDAATNGLTLLFLEKVNKARIEPNQSLGVFEAASASEKHKTPMVPAHFVLEERLDLVPASYRLTPSKAVSLRGFIKIADAIGHSRGSYDYIILDAQAGSDEFALVSMQIADEVVLVSEYDPISAEGVDRLRHLYPEPLAYTRTWVLLNKVLPEFARNLREFLGMVRYLSPIPWDADVIRAFTRRKLALDMDYGNAYTLAMMETALSLLGDEIKEQVEDWKKNRLEVIRKPLREQLEQIESMLNEKQERLLWLQYRKKETETRKRWALSVAISMAVAAVALVLNFFGMTIDFIVSYLSQNLFSVVGIVSAIAIAFSFIWGLSGSYSTDREIEIAREKEKLQKEINDLEEDRKRFKTLSIADFENILKQRERTGS